jgi:hypothetical protein
MAMAAEAAWRRQTATFPSMGLRCSAWLTWTSLGPRLDRLALSLPEFWFVSLWRSLQPCAALYSVLSGWPGKLAIPKPLVQLVGKSS